ncbi:MAG: hypothetical protein M1840_005285 [Geoglossum simile]|nr:MAG: hypothetical protein M1840_005285 [Geoglossum simile]
MSHAPLRIALLECDKPVESARVRLGGHSGAWRHLLTRAISDPTCPELNSFQDFEISSWDVVHTRSYPQLESLDGILVSGSRFNAFDDDPWILDLIDFISEAFARQARLIGVCFGHQIIARALGSDIRRNEKGWEAAVSTINLTSRGQEIYGKFELALHLMNRDIVVSLPIGAENLGFTDKCSIHGMYIAKKLITVQGHPEFSSDIGTEILRARNEVGVIPDDTFKDAMKRVGKEDDGVIVAQAFIKFLVN